MPTITEPLTGTQLPAGSKVVNLGTIRATTLAETYPKGFAGFSNITNVDGSLIQFSPSGKNIIGGDKFVVATYNIGGQTFTKSFTSYADALAPYGIHLTYDRYMGEFYGK